MKGDYIKIRQGQVVLRIKWKKGDEFAEMLVCALEHLRPGKHPHPFEDIADSVAYLLDRYIKEDLEKELNKECADAIIALGDTAGKLTNEFTRWRDNRWQED